MDWKLGGHVTHYGRAYRITAIMVNRETGRTHYTLNNIDFRYEFITIVGRA